MNQIAKDNIAFLSKRIDDLESENFRLRELCNGLKVIAGFRSPNKEEMAWATKRARELGLIS